MESRNMGFHHLNNNGLLKIQEGEVDRSSSRRQLTYIIPLYIFRSIKPINSILHKPTSSIPTLEYTQTPSQLSISIALINQNKPIPRLPPIHIPNRLIRLPQRPLHHPRLHPLLHAQLQHLLNLMRCTNRTARNLTSFLYEGEDVEGW